MKRLFLTAIILSLVTAVVAQRPGTRRSEKRTTTTENQAKETAKQPVNQQATPQTDASTESTSDNPEENFLNAIPPPARTAIGESREIIHKFGQAATPLGHQAHSVNGGYAALGHKNPWNVPAPEITPVPNAVGPELLRADPRDIFKWRGQTATKFGHEAASINGYASLGKKNPWEPDVNPMIIPVDPKKALAGEDNRDIHKLNGQTATKTGHEATAVGSGYASLKTRKD